MLPCSSQDIYHTIEQNFIKSSRIRYAYLSKTLRTIFSLLVFLEVVRCFEII